jgi:hypothetical protein
MAIKYLRSQFGLPTVPVKTTRPTGFKFPLGLKINSDTDLANSSTTATIGTFDVFVVGGGGSAGGSFGTYFGGGGGGGGVRLFSANSFSEVAENKNPNFITGTTNFIPVVVGGSGGNSCFGSAFIACRGGGGGRLGVDVGNGGGNGGTGGSGGGGGWRCTYGGAGVGGAGIVGQGCCGTAGTPGPSAGQTGSGGSATCSCTAPALCNRNGLTTSFTGTPIRYSDGGDGSPSPLNGCAGAANRGIGGNGTSPFVLGPGAGGSGIVAIRYQNPAAPTTPLATGGNCICCTGGCIIHIFTSSGFLNVNTSFSIN